MHARNRCGGAHLHVQNMNSNETNLDWAIGGNVLLHGCHRGDELGFVGFFVEEFLAEEVDIVLQPFILPLRHSSGSDILWKNFCWLYLLEGIHASGLVMVTRRDDRGPVCYQGPSAAPRRIEGRRRGTHDCTTRVHLLLFVQKRRREEEIIQNRKSSHLFAAQENFDRYRTTITGRTKYEQGAETELPWMKFRTYFFYMTERSPVSTSRLELY